MNHFIRIKGWDKYQHYKDRNPPWIKLHQELLTSLTWALADDASRVLAIALMMIAAKTGNRTPANPEYIKRVAYLHELPDFSQLIQLEFIEIIDDNGNLVVTGISALADASKMQAFARPETETEEETEREKKKPSARKARGASVNNTAVAKSTGESRHARIKQLVTGFYGDWAQAECPWGPGEAGQLDRLLKETPNWPDAHFVSCLENLALSECVPKGDSPKYWIAKLPRFLHGALDQYWKPKHGVNGNGNGSTRQTAAAARTARNLEVLLHQGVGHGVPGVHVPDVGTVQPRTNSQGERGNSRISNSEILAGKPPIIDA